jgi:hypothetical protein
VGSWARRDASDWQLKSDVFLGRATGELAEFADHVRLVEVAAVEGQFNPARCVARADPLDRALKPQDSCQTLGWCTQLIAELAIKCLWLQPSSSAKSPISSFPLVSLSFRQAH